MGIREHTTYTVHCDVCGHSFGDNLPFKNQLEAHEVAVLAGWTDDTFSTKCRNCVGVVGTEKSLLDSSRPSTGFSSNFVRLREAAAYHADYSLQVMRHERDKLAEKLRKAEAELPDRVLHGVDGGLPAAVRHMVLELDEARRLAEEWRAEATALPWETE